VTTLTTPGKLDWRDAATGQRGRRAQKAPRKSLRTSCGPVLREWTRAEAVGPRQGEGGWATTVRSKLAYEIRLRQWNGLTSSCLPRVRGCPLRGGRMSCFAAGRGALCRRTWSRRERNPTCYFASLPANKDHAGVMAARYGRVAGTKMSRCRDPATGSARVEETSPEYQEVRVRRTDKGFLLRTADSRAEFQPDVGA